MKDGHKLNGKSLGRKYENLHIFFVLVLWFACGGFIEWNGMDTDFVEEVGYNITRPSTERQSKSCITV